MSQMTPVQRAIQQAIDASNDPQVQQELRRFQQTGIPPTSQAAMTALSVSYMANGLPAPQAAAQGIPAAPQNALQSQASRAAAQAGAQGGAVDSGYGTGAGAAGPPAAMAAQNASGMGAGQVAGGVSASATGTPPPAQTGDNTDPYAPARAGAQGSDPNPAVPNRTPDNASAPPPPPTPALPAAGAGGGTTVSAAPPPPAAATGTGLGPQALNTLYSTSTDPQVEQSAFDHFLLSLGIDQNNPGLFGNALATRLKNIFLNTQQASGTGGIGKLWGQDALGGMADLANLIRTQGIAGVSNMGQQLMAALPGVAGQNNDPAQQQKLMNEALGLSAEGMNPYVAQGLAQQQAAANTLYSRDQINHLAAGAPPTNYLTFLQQQQNPAYQGILNLLSGGRG